MVTDTSHRAICCGHSSIFIFDWIFFIPAGIEGNNTISDEFEIRRDVAMDCEVSCIERLE